MPISDMERALQEAAEQLVRREVVYCVSYLVAHLFETSLEHPDLEDDLLDLRSQHYTTSEFTCDCGHVWWVDRCDDGDAECPQCGETAFSTDTDEGYNEVFEHWIVSPWLARELEARGEQVCHNLLGLTVWARTTTGQAISLDSVIEDIAVTNNADYLAMTA